MSDAIKLPDVPVTSTGVGATLLCLDSGGNLRRLNLSGLLNLLKSTESVVVRIALTPQDLDADQLTAPMVMYQANADLNSSLWSGYEWKNFPTSRPEGSFNLLTIATGSDKTQILTVYASPAVYLRTTQYSFAEKKRVWQNWVKFSGVIVGGGKALLCNTLRKSTERRAA